ncbi:hypothetical protein K1W54_04315 [Micromonospora sp. CPCC 205371]|nr:hypothetical protein [Micromonospora sp. CPCC 205371]
MRRQRCRNPHCPCVEHMPPPGYRFLSAQAVPPLGDGPVVASVVREETTDGQRRVYLLTRETGYRVELPLPASPPASWADAIARAERFVARKAVMAR